MADVLYLLVTITFFVLAAGFVRVCDKVIGPDAEQGSVQGAGEPDEEPDVELSDERPVMPAVAVR